MWRKERKIITFIKNCYFFNCILYYIHIFVHIWVHNETNQTMSPKRNGFATATNLGKTNKILWLQPKTLPQKPNLLLMQLNALLL